MNQETKIQRLIQLELSKQGTTFFRNETGNFWAGKVIHRDANTVTLSNPSHVACGLCTGSSDLIGLVPVTITADMVGRTLAVFAAIEVKTATGRVSAEQTAFINHVNAQGGLAGVARSPADAVELLSHKHTLGKPTW